MRLMSKDKLTVALFLIAVSPVCADLIGVVGLRISPESSFGDTQTTDFLSQRHELLSAAAPSSTPIDDISVWDWARTGTSPLVESGATGSQQIRSLPPAPGSASLFLSAVIMVGGWHLARSSKDLHLGAMPEWYHTGGPNQIGSATPLDLQFAPVAACCFERPTVAIPVIRFRYLSLDYPHPVVREYLSPANPRSPPTQL